MIIDHKNLAISRLVTQFRESTNLISYIRTLLLEANNLEDVFHSILNERWIDTAIGVQLDILGSIVGQPREIIDSELFGYFGFAINLESGSFGSVDNVSIGDRFREVNEPTFGKRMLSDSEYRLWIRARIITNTTSSTPEDIINQIKFFIETEQVLFFDGDTEYTVSIGKILTNEEKSTLLNSDIVPKTAGVKVKYLSQYDYNDFFGFQGVPNSFGLGSVSNTELGGKFGKLIT